MMTKTNVTKLMQRLIEAKAETIKLGMDVHAAYITISLQVDNSSPQRAITLSEELLVVLVRGLVAAGLKVHSCYETGSCGNHVHRTLTAIGVNNLVVKPRSLSDGRNQKTDGLDAAELVYYLSLYLSGNTRALTVITVPTPEQERDKLQGHLREQLKKSRLQWEARGRSLLLLQGFHVKGRWWARMWDKLTETLPTWLIEELAIIRQMVLTLDAEERKRRALLEAKAPKTLPKAVGALTWVLLLREVCDWGRFKNRGQVSSFMGLCPGVHQSGSKQRDGHINRQGNPRLRALLIELVWRLARWQPDYPPVRALVAGVARGAVRRKLAVTAARKLAVDLWRLATGQTTPEKLQLIVPAPV